MKIDDTNYMEGNKAVASGLLLFYHLATEGCFCGDETVYIEPELFEGFRYLDVVVEEAHNPEINENFLRIAAVIYVLCDLNDMITEHDDSFHSAEITKKTIEAFKDGRLTAIPETAEIFKLLESNETNFNFSTYSNILKVIYDKYVLGTFNQLANSKLP
ncbi:hypothetical protein [Spartinivicinus marinus]|nr:hypothetical protein [Spartinivicinus marinus]MCX4030341.1 hypothetical protein [Spartinivicinus marinus]